MALLANELPYFGSFGQLPMVAMGLE